MYWIKKSYAILYVVVKALKEVQCTINICTSIFLLVLPLPGCNVCKIIFVLLAIFYITYKWVVIEPCSFSWQKEEFRYQSCLPRRRHKSNLLILCNEGHQDLRGVKENQLLSKWSHSQFGFIGLDEQLKRNPPAEGSNIDQCFTIWRYFQTM